MKAFRLGATLCLLASALPSFGGSAILPAGLAGTAGSTCNNAPWFNGGVTYQSVWQNTEFAAIPVGSPIESMAMRQCAFTGGQPWPAGNINLTRNDIQMGPSLNPPNALNATFAANIGAGTQLSRSGPFSIAAGSYPGCLTYPTPCAFGPAVPMNGPRYSRTGNEHFLITWRTTATGQASVFFDGLGFGDARGTSIVAVPDTATVGSGFVNSTTKLCFQSPGGAPILDVTKALAAGQKDRIVPGETASWDITIQNTGSGALTDGNLSDRLDAGCFRALVSCAANVQVSGGVAPGSCSTSATGFSVGNFQLAPAGQPGDTITYRLTAVADFTTGSCKNTAFASDGCALTSDEDQAAVTVIPLSSQESVDAIEGKFDDLPCAIFEVLKPALPGKAVSSSPCVTQ